MNIATQELVSQLAEQIAHKLLNRPTGRLSDIPARRQNWRFQPPQRTPETEALLRAYWDDVLSARRARRAAEEEETTQPQFDFFHSSELKTDDNLSQSA